MGSGDIKFLVSVDMASGQASLKEFSGQVDKLGDTTKKGGDEAVGASTKHKSFIDQIAVGNIIADQASKLLHVFWNELKSVVGEAAESEKAQKGLDAALFSTGRTASYLPEHFRKFADELQRVTKYSDEETMRAQALILQLSNLDKEGLDKATKGAMGLAAVFNMELGPASDLVGKWMGGNTDRLTRYGIKVNDTMTAEQKRNSIIEQLLAYYPRVEAETSSYSGKLDILKNAYNEVKEAAGRYVTENAGVLKAINWLSNALYDLADAQGAVERAKKSGEAIDKAWSERFYTAANATKMTKEEVVRLIAKFTELGPVVKEDSSYAAALTGHLVEQEKAVKTNWQALAAWIIQGKQGPEMLAAFRAAVIATIKPFKDLKGETGKGLLTDPEAERKRLEAIKKILEKEKKARSDAREWLQKGQDDWYKEQLEKEKKNQEDVKKVHADARKWLMDNQKKYFEGIKEAGEKSREHMLKIIDDMAAGFGNLFGSLAALSRANADSRIDDLDRSYEAQKQQVIDSLMTEQQKADALKVLDEKHEIARKNLARSAAKDEKAYSIFQAIISTAAAVINAMTAKPFGPWNFIQAALVAALGVVQIATIKAQPLPLAKGFEGMVRQPTLFLAGEAGPEHLSVQPKEWGGGKKIYNFHIHNEIGGRVFSEQVVSIVEEAGRVRGLKIMKLR